MFVLQDDCIISVSLCFVFFAATIKCSDNVRGFKLNVVDDCGNDDDADDDDDVNDQCMDYERASK